MQNIPEINHCIPNPEAYWCSRCRAHTGFDIRPAATARGGDIYKCKECEARMREPSYDRFLRNSSCGCIVVFLSLGLLFWFIFTGPEAEEKWPDPGTSLLWALVAAGIMVAFGVFGWFRSQAMVLEWNYWRRLQEGKTASQLEQEALNHPFQAKYEDSRGFYEWAYQFFDWVKEWEQFKAKYEQGGKPVDEKRKR
ncbi:MAG: hypothetical protein NZ935_01905 [Planctomycetes bacterium]|nr:hypothetical protein [Planctomycetota bacterium]